MATPADYNTGTAALLAFVDQFIKSMVNAGKIPSFAEGQAESFVNQMAAPGAKVVIDAVDAEREKAGLVTLSPAGYPVSGS